MEAGGGGDDAQGRQTKADALGAILAADCFAILCFQGPRTNHSEKTGLDSSYPRHTQPATRWRAPQALRDGSGSFVHTRRRASIISGQRNHHDYDGRPRGVRRPPGAKIAPTNDFARLAQTTPRVGTRVSLRPQGACATGTGHYTVLRRQVWDPSRLASLASPVHALSRRADGTGPGTSIRVR